MKFITKMVFTVLILLLTLSGTIKAEAPIYEKLPNIKMYSFEKVLYKWGSDQWNSFDKLIMKESTWNYKAKNPKSTACGLGQTMMSIYGKDLLNNFCDDKYAQIDWTMIYIEDRYETPKKALSFHYKNNWY